MRTIFLSFIVILFGLQATAQPGNAGRLLDRPMPLKSANITINADYFTATTVMVLEFYNPNKVEMEGVYRFNLEEGQLVTNFRLDLNGKFRDGSIEEKWKATNAYNTIVGKRVDPALLTLEGQNNYRLNIYPIAASGSRRVEITIQQKMQRVENEMVYKLPLAFDNKADRFNLAIDANAILTPKPMQGIIEKKEFGRNNAGFGLGYAENDFLLNKQIAFALPIPNKTIACTKRVENTTHFALLTSSNIPAEIKVSPKKVVVFWDASGSTFKRDVNKEINFMKSFIASHKVNQITIIPFNHQMLDTAVFYTAKNFDSNWEDYLKNIEYDGATQLGLIDITKFEADMFLIFTDGKNTYGKSKPKTGNALVYCINSNDDYDEASLNNITGTGGGSTIQLKKVNMNDAVAQSATSTIWLMNVLSSNGNSMVEKSFPIAVAKGEVLVGTKNNEADTLTFVYGAGNKVAFTEKIVLGKNANCQGSSVDRISMFDQYQKLKTSNDWNQILDFGLRERIVTANTAYIVLEKVEDYVRYNIAPPKELEEECKQMGFVKRDSRQERIQIAKQSKDQILRNVMNFRSQQDYNIAYYKGLKQSTAKGNVQTDRLYYESDVAKEVNTNIPTVTATKHLTQTQQARVPFIDRATGGRVETKAELQDVVVTAFAPQRSKRDMMGSQIVRAEDLNRSGTTIQQILQGKVAGVNVVGEEKVLLRGATSIGKNNSPLFVMDGMPIDEANVGSINPGSIESVTVLKSAAATSLYGSRAVNGVILINSKYKRDGDVKLWGNYRLKDMEDVEYLAALKSADRMNKLEAYQLLRRENKNNALFYLDVAQHFFETGFDADAKNIAMNALEVSASNHTTKLAMAYILEEHKKFEQAVAIYKNLVNENLQNLNLHRNLAWALYQSGDVQQAVDVLVNAIQMDTENAESFNWGLKSLLVNDMNAMINANPKKIDLADVPEILLDSTSYALRVVLENNISNYNQVTMKEPGGKNATLDYTSFANTKGHWTTYYSSYYNTPMEYVNEAPEKGKYKIDFTNYNNYTDMQYPFVVKRTVYKNLGKANQLIENKAIMLNNQYGIVEIDELRY